MGLMGTFAKLLKAEVESGRVKVAAVARAAGCSRQHIYDIIDEETEVTLTLAQRIAEFCGFRLELKKSKKVPA